MISGWQTRSLGDVFGIGSSKRVHKSDWAASGVPFYRAREIVKLAQQGFVNNDLFISEELFEQHKSKTGAPSAGDLMVSAVGTLGICYLVKAADRFYFKDASVLRFQPRGEVTPRFMEYAFQSPQIKDQTTDNVGAVVGTLTISRAKAISLSFPPLSEQKRIVTILDEAFEGITTATANAEKNLTNARELFESYLNSVFTEKGERWTEKTVGEVAQHSLGKMLDKKKNKGEFQPYLRNINVRWFSFDLNDLLEMRFLSSETDRCTVRKGDLVICEGGYPGRAAVWNEDYPIYFQKALHRVRFDQPDQSKWLLYFLYLSNSNGNLTDYFTGAGIQHFTGKALHRFVYPIAPLSEMRLILKKMDQLAEQTDQLEAIYQQKLNDLAELKQSILQKAFSGELTKLAA